MEEKKRERSSSKQAECSLEGETEPEWNGKERGVRILSIPIYAPTT